MINNQETVMEIKITQANEDDIYSFVEFESPADVRQYIIPYSAERHAKEMVVENTRYLSIYDDKELVGFMILVVEEGESVEFRRIVVGEKGRGVGQNAILAMEDYCRNTLNKNRIWLDVFESNDRAIHIYNKLGFQSFSSCLFHNQRIWLMEKYVA